MNASTRHSLTHAAIISGNEVMEKSASASPTQQEVLNAAWPSEDSQSKVASLAQILATGLLVEEARI